MKNIKRFLVWVRTHKQEIKRFLPCFTVGQWLWILVVVLGYSQLRDLIM